MRALGARIPRGAYVGAGVLGAALANFLVGAGAATGQRAFALALLIGLLPALLIGFGALVGRHRAVLAWAAFALNLTGLRFITDPLPLPGGTSIFATDVLVLLAFGSWLAARLTRPRGAVVSSMRLSPIFGWPLVLLAVAIAGGVLAGHDRYGASIIGQPFRIVLYAGIALALLEVSPREAWRAITKVFYVGAVVQSLYAVYYLASGGAQTDQVSLSTGGTRVLALSIAIYLTGSLVCALLNLELERSAGRNFLHLGIAGLALFGILVSFGRTTYAAVALIAPLLFFSRRYLRRTVVLMLPILAPAVVLVLLVLPQVAPTVIPTLQARLTGTSTQDANVRWRDLARESALEGYEDERLRGVGFGRVTEFRINNQTVTIHGDPHNSYVYLLAGGGLLALGSFLLLCGLYVVDAVRRLRRALSVESALIVWSLATWLAFMVNALAGPIFSNPVMMLTMWVLMTLPSIVPRRSGGPAATAEAPAVSSRA